MPSLDGFHLETMCVVAMLAGLTRTARHRRAPHRCTAPYADVERMGWTHHARRAKHVEFERAATQRDRSMHP